MKVNYKATFESIVAREKLFIRFDIDIDIDIARVMLLPECEQ